MTRTLRALVIPIALAGVAVAAGAVGPTVDAGNRTADPCCFTNPRFAGVCEVTPSEDETCADILAYLNNPSSVGKTYCGKTKVRGGWAQVECDDPVETAATACGEVPDS